MELDWTTFALEIINFLVLVWILQRFLYKPVRNAIAARQAEIEKRLAEAQAVQAQADALKRQYETRVADWNQEREQARAALLEEISAERARRLSALETALEQEQKRNRALAHRREVELRQHAEADAFQRGSEFVARLLSRLASPALEDRICEVVLEDLHKLPESEVQILRGTSGPRDSAVRITSGFPLSKEVRDSLCQALGDVMGKLVTCEFDEDPNLEAGLYITAGPWVLRANLRDELQFFTREQPHAST